MDHFEEIKSIVNRYKEVELSAKLLEDQAKILEMKKNQIELNLAQIREDERTLIDKIKEETGETPDFYKILQDINNESITVV